MTGSAVLRLQDIEIHSSLLVQWYAHYTLAKICGVSHM